MVRDVAGEGALILDGGGAFVSLRDTRAFQELAPEI